MGYEIKLIIGRPGHTSRELKKTTERYDDNSGFKAEKDANGNFVYTGRDGIYFSVYATLDLCKLGYQDDEMNRLIKKSHAQAKAVNSTHFHYFYGTDGNTEITEDCYGCGMWPVPIADVITAIKESPELADYRRAHWALALLESMQSDTQNENLSVLFYGH